ASPKFGAYADDLDVYPWAREGAVPGRQCFEAQVMDLADDIAYSVHDIEDAITGLTLDLQKLQDPMARAAALHVVQDWHMPDAPLDELDAALIRLEEEPSWMLSCTGTMRAAAALKNMASQLIGRFTRSAIAATRATHGEGPISRYGGDIVVPEQTH